MPTPEPLRSAHLMTLTLQVDFAGMINIGRVPQGRRRIAPVIGGVFEGERLRGTVLPGGADWVVNRPDGAMAIDVRLALLTDDGARIACAYTGVFTAPEAVMTRFNRGEQLSPEDYKLRTIVRLEAGDERYAWLNDLLVVGRGVQTAAGPVYTLFEVL